MHRIINLSTVVASRVSVVCCWLQWCCFVLVLHVQLRFKSMSRSDVMVTLLYMHARRRPISVPCISAPCTRRVTSDHVINNCVDLSFGRADCADACVVITDGLSNFPFDDQLAALRAACDQ